MAPTNRWKLVTPGYVLTQVKGFRNAAQVRAFAESHDVCRGWWRNSSGTGRHFLVELTSFKKACAEHARQPASRSKARKPRRPAASAAPRPLKLHRGYTQSMRAWARIYTSRRAA